MIKEILENFNREANKSSTYEELTGYYYATWDMLYYFRKFNKISDVTYHYMIKKITNKRALIAYKKFQNVRLLNALEHARTI